MSCPYEAQCLNGPNGKEQCWRCTDLRLLQLPKDKAKIQAQRRATRQLTKHKDEPSHRQLEREVARKLSHHLTGREFEARQNPGSGNVWFRPGDVLHQLLHVECKERTATGNQKSFSFKKEWLDKNLQESMLTRKVPAAMFRFKDDEQIYAVMGLEDLVELVQELLYLKELKNNADLS